MTIQKGNKKVSTKKNDIEKIQEILNRDTYLQGLYSTAFNQGLKSMAFVNLYKSLFALKIKKTSLNTFFKLTEDHIKFVNSFMK